MFLINLKRLHFDFCKCFVSMSHRRFQAPDKWMQRRATVTFPFNNSQHPQAISNNDKRYTEKSSEKENFQ